MIKEYEWNEVLKKIDTNSEDHIIFLEFTTKWCNDCKMMAPVVNEISSKYENNKNITFLKVDAEEAQLFRNPDNKWQILRVPTHMVIKGNAIIEKGYEYYPKEILESWIEKSILWDDKF
ncbi:thioredoxin family protein [Mycoplasma crocodyli]|uniref:Putative thioredoxin n=1 Tax=Mycoplasma crocodyli (strain ATCC 51981 / MP145) TaxID=512564 RepID=D5E676_MYCCM|nr:thioredoxin family protein [Mycoplasma crocodyli]ADE19726.1 putative thioredoxin [Mycoplasma crocodyli MP145]